MSTTRGQIVTFYSYKGGTGRSMALANIACLLARRYSVLAIDWDLEAPGLHRFFRPLLKERFPLNESGEFELNRHPGLINLFTEIEKSISEDRPVLNQSVVKNLFSQNQLERYILKTSINRLSILKAGSFDDTYSNLINSFPWNSLFERAPWLYLAFGQQLARRYDFVLIDSRTGLTDTSGICTMLMPDRLVTVFTPNFQSSSGVLDIVRRAVSFRRSTDDLRPLIVFPLVSRIDPTRSVAERSWGLEIQRNV
ncbi:MAG: AAA family ATPase [Chloroflexi bacterium]|uniref:tyrosine-protein kinase family protein n=1 Tax=Candidatus Flexifilum breve TaxID=3140694 RepID=UPI0031376732|nr:AAA family ATPase [Chloroflexota bacterium]